MYVETNKTSGVNVYRPQTKLPEGNVFTRVCDSFCSRGGGARETPLDIVTIVLTPSDDHQSRNALLLAPANEVMGR